DSVNITFSSTVPGTTYTWSVAASNIASSYPATGDETTINQAVQLIDPMIAGSLTFDIMPTANGCSGAIKRVEVIVNPIPVITVPTVDDTEICTGETVTIDVNGTPTGIVYHWQVVNATNAQVAGGVTSGTSTATEIDVVLQATS
ncbi:PKD-like domain-containing protein, partial [Flavobacterium enshiense]|uniref:PKD-like domain-containing protein n=1 Tax=Flavobacterium enshiense TaxID=1341165 RepID=UPI00345DF54A